MTPSKAILAGSLIIAAAILGSAALFLPDRSPAPAAGGTPATTAASPPSTAQSDRYQIVKIENGSSWRLDRQTGEMTYCRVEDDRMICAKSTEATELPKASPDQLKAEREQAEKRQAKENDAFSDKVIALFDRFLNFIERQSRKSKSSPEPSEGQRSL